MYKNANRSISITLCITKFQVDQKNFNIKGDTSPIEEKLGNCLEFIGIGNKFLNRTPIAEALRLTTKKWNIMKLKSIGKVEDTINKTKW